MKSARARHPQFDGLESIALLSVAVARPATAAALISASRHPASHPKLTGSVGGNWTSPFGIPDVGASQDLAGAGFLQGLGNVHIEGTLHLTGFVRFGHASGNMTVSNRHGSVTLALTGPTQPGFSGPPKSFRFTVASATGRYVGLRGSGKVEFHETNSPPQFTLKIVEAMISHRSR